MQQNMFPEHNESDSKNKVSSLGRGLAIHFIKPGSEARLFRQGVFTKTVDLSDKTARRLFIVDTVELGATKALLAKALGISRQTIHNYIETQKNFGREGLIHSYHAANSKSRATQRKEHKEKLSKGNKARRLEAMRREEREARKQEEEQRSLFSTAAVDGVQTVPPKEQPFSQVHDWKATRYAGVFLYLICLISEFRWFDFVAGHFGGAYKIFMVFVLMVGRNIPSIEQLKNIRAGEAGAILGLGKLPSKPNLWKWFYTAADMKKSELLCNDYFRHQIRTGAVGVWFWFIDGHLLPYSGKQKVHYSYNTQRRMPMPGRTNLVTCDSSGRIVDFDIQEGKGDLRTHIVELKKKWQGELPDTPLMVFDREGYGGDFFNALIQEEIPFVTWDKYVDTAKLATIESKCFKEKLIVNNKEYRLFEGEKTFSYTLETLDDEGKQQKQKFTIRRIYIWNKSSNRRTCGLAWTGDRDVSTTDCARAILNRWGASENTFKHLADRHPFHYHPGFRTQKSEDQEIANPEIKKQQTLLKSLKTKLGRLYKKIAKAKDAFKKDGSERQNSVKKRLGDEISALEAEVGAALQTKDQLPERVDVSGLEDYRSFKRIDNEGKNLFDFVTSSVWNARKQMVDWLGLFYNQENEVVDLFYAITHCHGWVKSGKTEVIVRLEPIQQPKRQAAQVQLCRKLTSLGARLPSGKWLKIEVGDDPT